MITLTEAERAVYTARLAQAREAYHTLMIGGQAKVYVDQSGERIEYTASSVNKLTSYIASLEALLDPSTMSGPLNVFF